MAYSFGTDYGKDLLVDLNQLAHTAGTDSVRRDCFQRAYREIRRLSGIVIQQQLELGNRQAKAVLSSLPKDKP